MKKMLILLILVLLVSCQNNEVNSNTSITVNTNNVKNEDELFVNEMDNGAVNKKDSTNILDEDINVKSQVMIIADVLNVRSSNNIDSDIVGKLSYGDVHFIKEVLLDNDDRKWYRINYNGKDGWIAEWFCYDYFEISTLEDFVTYLGNNRILKLTPEMANMDMQLNDSNELSEYLSNHTISGLSNLTIEGDLDKPIKFYTSETKTVLTLENCSNISIRGLEIGHEIGPCEGDVISVIDSEDIRIESSILYGCGFIGVSSYNSDITVLNSKLMDCFESAFHVDKSSTLVVDNCTIEKVPSVFSEIVSSSVLFRNSVILVPIYEDAIYNDRLFREGNRHYKLNFRFKDIDFKNTLYMPISINLDVLDFLRTVDINEYVSLKLIPNGDGFDLNMIINYETLNEKDIVVEELMSFVDEADEISITNVYGSILKEEETIGRWRWDIELDQVLIDQVYYPYTGELLGIESIDLKSYIGENFDLEQMFLEDIMVIEVLPSYIKEDQLIHEVVFEFVELASDFDIYIGAMMLVRYNQSEDTLEIEIEDEAFKEIGTIPNDALGVIDTYKKLYNLFEENVEYLHGDPDFKCKYDFTQEEFDFINGVFDSIFMDELKESLIKGIELTEIDGVFYSKCSFNDFLFDLKIYEPVIFNKNDLYIYGLNRYQFKPTLTVMKPTDTGYKFDSHRNLEFMNKNNEGYNSYSKWYINVLNYK